MLSMPPIAEHYVPQQNQHFQPPQPPQVMMRQHDEGEGSFWVNENIFSAILAKQLCAAGTANVKPSNFHDNSTQPNAAFNDGPGAAKCGETEVCPIKNPFKKLNFRSFLDQPFPPAPEQSQQPSAATSYSMMTTMPAGDQRKGSLGDEEFPDPGSGQNSNESAGVDEPLHNNGDGTPKPLQFVPICRYEDAQVRKI